MSLWSAIQLWLIDSPIETLGQDLILALIYSAVIAGTILPLINRSTGFRLAKGKAHKIMEDTLGCLLAALSLSVLLAIVLISTGPSYRDILHLSILLMGVALMANCWILATVLISCGQNVALIKSLLAAVAVLILALSYQPGAGLIYHELAWLCAIATMLLSQARSLTACLPRPSRIGLSVINLPTSIELSMASTSMCIGLWLSRPSAHALWQNSSNMQTLETCQSIAYLVLLPVAILAWTPLEKKFKSAFSAFEKAANGGGNLSELDYQKYNLISQSLSGMQRVYIVLIAVVAIALTFNHLAGGSGMKHNAPNWMLALSLIHVALQMVSLCAMRLLFYLQRDRELLWISLLQLFLVTIFVSSASFGQGAIVLPFGLVLCSGSVCLVSVGLLRHRLQRLDYLYFIGAKHTLSAAD